MRHLLNVLYVTNPDAYLHKHDDAIEVKVNNKRVMSVPFHLLEGVVLFGHVGCSASLMAACAVRGVRVVILDERARFQARVEGPISGNVLLRREQYRRAMSPDACLDIAKRFVIAKIHNSRVVLQHFGRDYPEIKSAGIDDAIDMLFEAIGSAKSASSLDELRGIEGDAARMYFSVFNLLLRVHEDGLEFPGRTRRPPTDPVNAALSFFYTLASRDLASGCETVGLDPQMGYLHACRPGRSSLALDLVEELRAPYVDRFVLSLFNRKQLGAADFVRQDQGVFFNKQALKKSIGLWQEKKRETMRHPFLDEKVELGLLPFIQAQLFARYLRGDLDDYPAILWR